MTNNTNTTPLVSLSVTLLFTILLGFIIVIFISKVRTMPYREKEEFNIILKSKANDLNNFFQRILGELNVKDVKEKYGSNIINYLKLIKTTAVDKHTFSIPF